MVSSSSRAHARSQRGHTRLKQRQPTAASAPVQPEQSEPGEVPPTNPASGPEAGPESDQASDHGSNTGSNAGADTGSDADSDADSDDSSSDSESELRERLQKLRARTKPLKKTSWRDSAIHKRRQQPRALTIANDSVHSDKHREFLDKFIK